jgi:hypothetical protein
LRINSERKQVRKLNRKGGGGGSGSGSGSSGGEKVGIDQRDYTMS